MVSINRRIKQLTLILGDIVVLHASLYLTLSLRYQELATAELWSKHIVVFYWLFLFWAVVFYINRLYDVNSRTITVDRNKAILGSMIWCTLISVAFFYLLASEINPKTILLIELIIYTILIIFWRDLYNRMIKSSKMRERVMIIGDNETVKSLTKEINENPQTGMRVVAIMSETRNGEIEDIIYFQDWKNIPQILKTKKIKNIILAIDKNTNQGIIEILFDSLDKGINIVDLPTFSEQFMGKIPIDTIGQVWFLENLSEREKIGHDKIARALEVVLALVFFIITLPLYPIFFFLVKISSPGPVLFHQIRVGKNGRNFVAIKLRTMREDAEKNGPQWTKENDPRVTSIGKFLRETRIDEVPQLLNIIKGDMSFIGPRPERPEFVEKLRESIPFYETRLLVKPGLTGWAQINFPYGASEKDAHEKLQYDLYYIKNRSFSLDISILLKTVETVLSRKGR